MMNLRRCISALLLLPLLLLWSCNAQAQVPNWPNGGAGITLPNLSPLIGSGSSGNALQVTPDATILQITGGVLSSQALTTGCSGPGCATSGVYTNADGSSCGASFTDEDDTVCLTAWLAGTLATPYINIAAQLPPAPRASGYYNICPSSWIGVTAAYGLTIPQHYPQILSITGYGARIRILPSCNAAYALVGTANGMVNIPFETNGGFSGYNTADYVGTRIEGVTFDGWQMAAKEIQINQSRLVMTNIIARNSFGNGSDANSNIECLGAGQIYFAGNNQLGNFNDPFRTSTYTSSSSFPYANFYNISCHDSFVGNLNALIDARDGNIVDFHGDGMWYIGSTQGYGLQSAQYSFTNGGDANYNLDITDNVVMVDHFYCGGAIIACLHITHPTASGNTHPAAPFHRVEIVNDWVINNEEYFIRAGYGAQYSAIGNQIQNVAIAAFGQEDSGGTIQTTVGAWFASQVCISGNFGQLINLVVCNDAVAFGSVTAGAVNVQALAENFTTADNGANFDSGNGTVTPSTGSTITAGAGPGTNVQGGTALASLTLAFPNPVSAPAFPANYKYYWLVDPPVAAPVFTDFATLTTDIVGAPPSLPGHCLIVGTYESDNQWHTATSCQVSENCTLYASPGTYTYNVFASSAVVEGTLLGGGASGAGGVTATSGTAYSGGAGGSAAAMFYTGPMQASLFTGSNTIVVGAGGASVAAGAQGNLGNPTTAFGFEVFGPGSSSPGGTVASASGGTGGWYGAGGNASGATAGAAASTGIAGISGVSAAAGTGEPLTPGLGTPGGGSSLAGGFAGGAAIWGPSGGGSGAAMPAVQAGITGALGGYAGQAGHAGAGAIGGGAGAAGKTAPGQIFGSGGAGGGNNTAGVGGAGGTGAPGAGGGGGGDGTTGGGTGGAGGSGQALACQH